MVQVHFLNLFINLTFMEYALRSPDGVRVEGRFSGRVGRLRSVSASRGYWGSWCLGHLCLQGLLGHFLGFLFPHLAMHEAGNEGGDHKDA